MSTEARRAYMRAWNARDKMRKRYNISLEFLKNLRDKQGGRCAICGKEKSLVVDHDHMTGKVRALLCHTCNVMLGFIEKHPERVEPLLRYLRAHKESVE